MRIIIGGAAPAGDEQLRSTLAALDLVIAFVKHLLHLLALAAAAKKDRA